MNGALKLDELLTPVKTKSSSLLPRSYAPLLADLKARVRAAQVKAAVSVNQELIARR